MAKKRKKLSGGNVSKDINKNLAYVHEKNTETQRSQSLILGSAVFVLSLSVYLNTLMLSIPGGDSGELVAEACGLGVAHPPGYPLYTWVGHVWNTIFPFGSAAWKMNLLSSILGSIAAALLSMSTEAIIRNEIGAVCNGRSDTTLPLAAATGLLYAFCPLVWQYAVGSEVFAMNNFFCAAIVYIAMQFSIALDRGTCDLGLKPKGVAYIGAALAGLAMCNQHTAILFLLPIIGWVLFSLYVRKSLDYRTFFGLASTFFGTLLPYTHMSWASTFNLQRGSWGDQSTLVGFVRHLRRADYGTFKLYVTERETAGMAERLYLYITNLTTRQSLYVGPFLAFSGALITCLRNGRRRGILLLATYSFYMFVFHYLANLPLHEALLMGVQARFWQQPNIIVFIWIGVGLEWVVMSLNRGVKKVQGKITNRSQATASSSTIKRVTEITTTFLPYIIGTSLVWVQLYLWYDEMDQSHNDYIVRYARALAESLPPNSIFLTNYDHQWTALRYLQSCEAFRTDISFLNLSLMTYAWFGRQTEVYPEIQWPGKFLVAHGSPHQLRGVGFSLKDFLEANENRFPGGIFLGGALALNDSAHETVYEWRSHGLLHRLERRDSPPSMELWRRRSEEAWAAVDRELPLHPPLSKYSAETWEWTINQDYWRAKTDFATQLLEYASFLTAQDPTQNDFLIESARILEESVHDESATGEPDGTGIKPRPKYIVWKNLGVAYSRMVANKHPLAETDITDEYPFPSWLNLNEGDFKAKASLRTYQTWGRFLSEPQSKRDPGYHQVSKIMQTLQSAKGGV